MEDTQTADQAGMSTETMKPILEWLEEVPFTKESALRNITREFSDG